MTLEESNMEQSRSSQKKRRNSGHNQNVKQTYKMKKTDSKDERMLADTYCQTVTMQLKIEENTTEDLTNNKSSQTEPGNNFNQPTLMGPKPANRTLVHSTELGDPPLLRLPQHSTMTGIQQIIDCFRSGTVQAKLTLLNEVDTIFECQLCRSLFRCLPNLLEHRRFYCLSKQPEPDDPSQVIKDLLEAVFPQRNHEETSPVRAIPNPVCQDRPNSHHQNSVSQKLCCREPVVVLRRFQQPPATLKKVGPVSQKAGGNEQIERKDSEEEGFLSNVQETMTSAEFEQAESDLEKDTVSPSHLKKQRSSSHKAVHVKLGRRDRAKDNIQHVPTLKKLFCCRVCKRMFISHLMMSRHMNIDHNIRTLQKDSVNKAKRKSAPGCMEGNGETCEEPLSSVGKRCHVCQKSLEKKGNVHCHCIEVRHGLKQDCTTPTPHLSTQTTPVPQPSSKPVKESSSSQEAAQFSKVGFMPWMKDLFCCGLCKGRYSSQVLLMKHMSMAHKFFVLENSNAASRTPPPRKAKTKVEPEDKAFDNVRVYCWLCGKSYSSRHCVRKHCHRYHKQKLNEIDVLMNEGTGPQSLAHELHSLENGFAASHTPPTPSLLARQPE
ncbi:zinc finger protein 800-like [Colossoma macropomum]|uniref:zinc finger protein 800-like n=1 Tax=Colossoma macropomum TaxID=42526 RepID=UPI001864AC5B|nr:zinc finger protein 800-like [Colossoma macropomum]